MLAAALLVLIVAAANVALLLLARSIDNRRNWAMRMALGASPKRVFAAILGEAVAVVVAGMGIGMLLAWFWRQTLATMIYGVSPSDPWSQASALLVMAFVAALAAVVPALRASAIAPAEALRDG